MLDAGKASPTTNSGAQSNGLSPRGKLNLIQEKLLFPRPSAAGIFQVEMKEENC